MCVNSGLCGPDHARPWAGFESWGECQRKQVLLLDCPPLGLLQSGLSTHKWEVAHPVHTAVLRVSGTVTIQMGEAESFPFSSC